MAFAALCLAISAEVRAAARADCDPAERGQTCVTVLGPQDAVRTRGKSWVWTRFSVPDRSAPHTLRIRNGGANGEMRRVTSAMVWLNGHLVVSPKRFRHKHAVIEVPVRVRSHNVLWIRLHGKPGSGFTFQIDAKDEKPPVISAVEPGDGTVVSDPEVTLTVTASDTLSGVASVTCNGLESTFVDPDYACTVPLLPGSNAIEVVATDRCGNSSVRVVQVTFDPPPVVTITSPVAGSVLFANPVIVTGTVDDPAAEVTVNGVPATGGASFIASLVLPAGENTITAIARDAVGGLGTDSVEVTLILGPGPTVKISSPKDGFVTGGRGDRFTAGTFRVPVSGEVSGTVSGGEPEVSVNGIPVQAQLHSCSSSRCRWRFATADLGLPVGPQIVTAIGSDLTGLGAAEASGIVDACFDGDEATGNALADPDDAQSNRCHVIDGCSTPDWVVDDVQDPTAGELGQSSTAFGKDTDTGSTPERFPFGAPVRDKLPCNLHDVCYQTCVDNPGDRAEWKTSCDDEMKVDMDAVCKKAYPESSCPFTPNFLKCESWRGEKSRCYTWARRYRAGLRSPQAQDRFELRQGEYCAQ